jgi:hypothetical protein
MKKVELQQCLIDLEEEVHILKIELSLLKSNTYYPQIITKTTPSVSPVVPYCGSGFTAETKGV